LKKKKKFQPGLECLIDSEESAVIRKAPFKNHGDTFIVVEMVSESSGPDGGYVPCTYSVRLPLERVTLQ